MLLGCVAVFAFASPAVGQTASIGYNFEASNSTESGFIPPDTNGAVGPNHIVVQANGRSKMFNKAGTQLNTQTLLNFWRTRAGQAGTRVRRVTIWRGTVPRSGRKADTLARFARARRLALLAARGVTNFRAAC